MKKQKKPIEIRIKFIPCSSASPDYWLADENELIPELIKILPDVTNYSSGASIEYNGHKIENIDRCYNMGFPPRDGNTEIPLKVLPSNL